LTPFSLAVLPPVYTCEALQAVAQAGALAAWTDCTGAAANSAMEKPVAATLPKAPSVMRKPWARYLTKGDGGLTDMVFLRMRLHRFE
jgi:hypothetical protein